MSTESALLTILTEKINNDSLILPTLPAIAIRVREAAEDPDVNLAQMADVISQDPALSVRLIKVANSAYMGRRIKVETLNQAVTRIGLRQIKNVATALAMEQLFVSKNELVKEFLDKSWDKTIEVAATAIATLSLYLQKNKRSSLNLDTITLAALVHNIGVLPILTEAERHHEVFAKTEFLESAIIKLAGPIGGKVMRAWGFSEEFIVVAEKWNNANFNDKQVSYLDFVRLGAIKAGLYKTNVEERLNVLLEKGAIDDVALLNSDEFAEIFNDAKTIFA